MTIDINNIHVFKTNIASDSDMDKLKSVFNENIDVIAWSVDMEDIDCVLRVVSASISPKMIMELVIGLGYHCIELE